MQSTFALEEAIRKAAPSIAKGINDAAAAARNEAEFRRPATNILEKFAKKHLGLSFRTDEERTLVDGRADAIFNRFVVEYEPPRSLRKSNTHKANQHAIDQVRQYQEGLHKVERQRLERLAGVATDGNWYIFARYVDGAWHVDEPLPVTAASTESLLRYLVALGTEIGLTPQNLVRDFGEKSSIASACVSAFYEALDLPADAKVKLLFEQWTLQFAEVCGYDTAERVDLASLAKAYTINDDEPDAFRLFFAIHTYYAIFIKILALQIAHFYLAPRLGTGLSQVSSFSDAKFREYLSNLEDGAILRELGIRNFLEGDFFQWYLAEWDSPISSALRSIVAQLANYSLVTLDVDPARTRDLPKGLYQNIMPRQVRHDLGQYFTPDWLAERLFEQLAIDGRPERRILDPACGSGTFLVLAIQHIREYVRRRPFYEADVLEAILSNVVGFDLDPLAVMTSRTNYLLALGDLLQHRRGDISIPVYLADSILTPAQGAVAARPEVKRPEPRQKQLRMMSPQEKLFRFPTVVGEFAIPPSLLEARQVDGLASLLDGTVGQDLSSGEFRSRASAALDIDPGSRKDDLAALGDLYAQLVQLHKASLNGVWARIIKNAFAPLFAGKFDYVIGNPPWIGWEHLPGDYRQRIIPLYQDVYSLFVHKGMSARHGSTDIDISTLMTYVAADRYLKDRGRLGFVITQTVFKTTASNGFRRFELPGSRGIRVEHVDDMVQLKPFENASNRTSVLVLRKGYKTRYPVSYTVWKKKPGRANRIASDASLTTIRERTVRRNWVAEPVDRSNPLSPWLTGRPLAISASRKLVGPSSYVAHKGADTSGANAVYWLEELARRPDGLLVVENMVDGAKNKVKKRQRAIESDFVHPLLRGRDVQPWAASPSALILAPQDPDTPQSGVEESKLRVQAPRTYKFLNDHREFLEKRAGFVKYLKPSGAPFYSLYDFKGYTLAPHKVVWREQARPLTSAVVETSDGNPTIPDHKLVLCAVGSAMEAHYLCALLNSSPSRFVVESYAISIQISTNVFIYVAVPSYDSSKQLHRRLAQLSRRAHKAATEFDPPTLQSLQQEIDDAAAMLWGLNASELTELQQALVESLGKTEQMMLV